MEQEKVFSKVEKRWIVREIQSGRMSIGEARERFELRSKDTRSLINGWIKQYSSDIPLTLPIMTEKERQKLDAAHKRMRDLEKQLEDAQMKTIALETIFNCSSAMSIIVSKAMVFI